MVVRRETRRWDEEGIEDALRELVQKLGRWPKQADFRASGRGALLAAIQRRGGLASWASRLGFDPPRSRTGRFWTDARIEEALGRLLADRTTWPTPREFEEAGLGRLYFAIQRHGGHAAWAARHELPRSGEVERRPGPGRPAKWGENEIENALMAVVGELGHWPTAAELLARKQGDLLGAINRHGGLRKRAHRHELSRSGEVERRPGSGRPARWGESEIESALKAVVDELGRWPTAAELLARKQGDLLGAINRRGGLRKWARRFGTQPLRGGRERHWTDEHIEVELRAFVVGRSNWPTKREFEEAGLERLHDAIRHHGGSTLWAERVGLMPPTPRRPRQAISA